jgi:superfamily I DNA/RNA helicase/mRNA-degrading endonuclease RelE of RelBE toxin-antitoxin system
MSFEIDLKPTFMNQLLALPQREVVHVMEKVRLLQEAPQPDQKNKKRLKGYKGAVYRIRAGTYRILYTFGNGWVALLGVDHRKDVYDNGELVAEGPSVDLASIPDASELLSLSNDTYLTQETWTERPPKAEELPVRIDEEFLVRLRIPQKYVPALAGCRTVDDLLEADVPEVVRTRVFDVVTSPDYDRVLHQPSFVALEVDDLLRFRQGELLDFLLKLNPEQEKYVDWAIKGAGPTLVKGGPGTGKSTIALYRVRSLRDALKSFGVTQPRILFTTYTNALAASSRQLLSRLLQGDINGVTVRTADSLVREIVASTGASPLPVDRVALRESLKHAMDTAQFEGSALQRRVQLQTISRLTQEYLLDEIEGVIVAREVRSLDEYLGAPRAGRRIALNANQRTAVWRVHEALERTLSRRGQTTWPRLRRRATQIVRDGGWMERFDGVVVDEAQDLDPTVLRLLVSLCRTPDRLFVTADANQSIYGSSFRWTEVHADLRFQGRTGILRQNHRSTQEIGLGAEAYLRNATLDDDTQTDTIYVANGPLPAVRSVTTSYEEQQVLVQFLHVASREFRLGMGACGVLVPTEGAGQAIASRLQEYGIEASFMPGRELDLEQPVVKVITQQSAKGLEFPIVAVAGFIDARTPGAPRGASDEEVEEALLQSRRRVYVAMTRAMRALLVVVPSDIGSPLFDGFDQQIWNAGPVSAA